MSDSTGQTINQYRLQERLGDGGMGAVYKAYDANLDRTVAIKLMHPHFARQEEFRARLKQEARTAAQLEHPSIVRIYDFGDSEAGLYIAMEYVSGGSLRAHLHRLQRMEKSLPIDQALQIGIQIAEALDYAHKHGVIHRDVKPGNIILRPLSRPEQPGEYPFRAVLTDFGLVKIHESSVQTQTGLTMGTPIYMSPEQCQGEELDGRSDLYSLGVVLYELITNRPTFNFKSLSEALATHIRGEMPPSPSELRQDVPPLVDAILLRMLAKNPDERFEDGEQVVNVLQSAMLSLADSPTRFVRRTAAADTILGQAADEAPPGYHMHIEAADRTAHFMPLNEPVIHIGRGADNEMVLPTDGVSRHHARIQAMTGGWGVVDLGGLNGTFLNGRRLKPNEIYPLTVGSRLQVGPYTLTLDRDPRYRATARRLEERPPDPAVDALRSFEKTLVEDKSEAGDPLSIYLTRDKLAAEPGNPATLGIEIVNRTGQADRVSLRVQGLPVEWVTLPDGFVDVPAGGSAQLKIQIRAPRRPDTPIGRQRFRVEVISQQHPNLDLGANGAILLGSYSAFDARLEPQHITAPETVFVTIQNLGNSTSAFQVGLDVDEQRLKVRGRLPIIRIEPGQQARVELPLETKFRLFGDRFTYDYDIKVTQQDGTRKTLTGEADIKGLLSMGMMYLLGFLVIGAVLIACATFGLRRGSTWIAGLGFGSGATQPAFTYNTPTATFDPLGLGATADAATATAVFVATQTALTPSPTSDEGDRDQDGLSDRQEIQVTLTDPGNPDTDGDGLTDGQEVLQFGTNPLNRDTDGDLLLDGDEVFRYKTNPRLADTDGDGINDGVEVGSGTDPLVGITTTPTAGPTATPSVTPTPSLTTTPVTPSPTPTATTTSSPSATPTPKPSATITPTPLPTNTPTVTPTITPLPGDIVTGLRCVSKPPVIDGAVTVAEWGGVPLQVVQSNVNPTRITTIYAAKDAANLYLAFVIEGQSNNLTESLRVYIDTTNDAGDPDISDRFLQVLRDGTMTLRIGSGTSSDGKFWDEVNTANWQAAASPMTSSKWVVEMSIDLASELPILSNPFALGVQVSFTAEPAELLSWPQEATSNDAKSWQDVANVTCPRP